MKSESVAVLEGLLLWTTSRKCFQTWAVPCLVFKPESITTKTLIMPKSLWSQIKNTFLEIIKKLFKCVIFCDVASWWSSQVLVLNNGPFESGTVENCSHGWAYWSLKTRLTSFVLDGSGADGKGSHILRKTAVQEGPLGPAGSDSRIKRWRFLLDRSKCQDLHARFLKKCQKIWLLWRNLTQNVLTHLWLEFLN